MKDPCVYILTNKRHTVLYTGVTSELYLRMRKHREKVYKNSFTARYNVHKLVYFEKCKSMLAAIAREKQIKAGSRKQKITLINRMNPRWYDLFQMLEGIHPNSN